MSTPWATIGRGVPYPPWYVLAIVVVGLGVAYALWPVWALLDRWRDRHS